MVDEPVDKLVTPSPGVDPYAKPIDPRNANYSIMTSYGPEPKFDMNILGMTFGEIGQSGLRAFAGWVREEFLPELQGRQGAQKFREMGDSSPTIGAILFAVMSTMRKVEWRTIPVNDSGEARAAAEFVDSCRDDMSHTWDDFVMEMLSMLQFGYAPHEIVYEQRLGKRPPANPNGTERASSRYDDNAIGWRRLPLRSQETVLKWFFSPYGQPTGMTQLPWTGAIRDIPMEKMLLFRPFHRKANPEGRSILRTAYVPYYFVKRLQNRKQSLASASAVCRWCLYRWR